MSDIGSIVGAGLDYLASERNNDRMESMSSTAISRGVRDAKNAGYNASKVLGSSGASTPSFQSGANFEKGASDSFNNHMASEQLQLAKDSNVADVKNKNAQTELLASQFAGQELSNTWYSAMKEVELSNMVKNGELTDSQKLKISQDIDESKARVGQITASTENLGASTRNLNANSSRTERDNEIYSFGLGTSGQQEKMTSTESKNSSLNMGGEIHADAKVGKSDVNQESSKSTSSGSSGSSHGIIDTIMSWFGVSGGASVHGDYTSGKSSTFQNFSTETPITNAEATHCRELYKSKYYNSNQWNNWLREYQENDNYKRHMTEEAFMDAKVMSYLYITHKNELPGNVVRVLGGN